MNFVAGMNPYEAGQSCLNPKLIEQEKKKGEANLVEAVALMFITERKDEGETTLKREFDYLMRDYRSVVHTRAVDTHPSIKSEWDKLIQFAELHPEYKSRLPKELGYPQVLVYLCKHPKNNKTSRTTRCDIL